MAARGARARARAAAGGAGGAQRVLVANTGAGAHAFFGLHLAGKLRERGHAVTILNAGDPAKVGGKGPFAQYERLEREGGVEVVWGDPADAGALPAGEFDVVYDNNGKDLAACQGMADRFKGRCSQYIFVSSAGMAVPPVGRPCIEEDTPCKESAGHLAVERYLAEAGLPWTSFRPLYPYGPHTAKDCEHYFLDRILRDRPVCLPGPGTQLTSLTHVEDVAELLASAVGAEKAVGEVYNCCADNYYTHEGIAQIAAAAAGKECEVVTYDNAVVGLGKKEQVPFRPNHFFASAGKARRELGWEPKHTLEGDMPALIEDFIASGRLEREVDFSADDKVLQAVRSVANA